MGGGSRLEAQLSRVKANLAAGGSVYEAQQVLKTLSARLRTQKNWADLVTLLTEGAVLQFSNGAVTCGCELGAELLDAVAQSGLEATEENKKAVLSVVAAIPPGKRAVQAADHAVAGATGTLGLDADSAASARLVQSAIKWANRAEGGQELAEQLHDVMARYLWGAVGLPALATASGHFARGSDASAFTAVLAEAIGAGSAAETDLFLTRAALQLCAAGRPDRVRELFRAFGATPGAPEVPDCPLMRFVGLYTEALERDSESLAVALRAKYASALAADPGLDALLDAVEALAFGRGAGAGRPGGILGELLSAFMDD